MGSLLSGGLIPGFSVSKDEKLNVKISIPRDHPKAEKLLALAEELASRRVLPSGIVVDYAPKPVYDDRLLKLLRDIVDVDEIMAEAARRYEAERVIKAQEDTVRAITNPATSLAATAAMLKGAHELLPVNTNDKEMMGNLLRERGAL